MKRKDVEATFIKIDGMTLMKIVNHSGLNLKMIRTGNRFHSTRNTCLVDPYKNKSDWEVVAYSYSKVEDPRYFKGRNLEVSENWLNPKFKYLLDRV